MNFASVASKAGQQLDRAGVFIGNQVYQGAGKLGKEVSANTAASIGKGVIGGAVALGTVGFATGLDDGIGRTAGGTICGAGLGAVGGAGVGAVAAAIAKGVR